MPCDTRLKPRQTISERKAEVAAAAERTRRGILNGTIKPKVGKDGGIAFEGLTETDRDGVTDGCMYRRLLSSASSSVLEAFARAEALSGRKIDGQAIAHGLHSHDGGKTWHHGH